MRKPIADFDAALSVLLKSDLQWIESVSLIAISIRNHQSLEGQPFRILSVRKWSLRNCLPFILGKHRLRIEALHVTDSAVHEQPNHVLCFGCKVRFAIGWYPSAIAAETISLQHGRKCDTRESQTNIGEKPTSSCNVRELGRIVVGECHGRDLRFR